MHHLFSNRVLFMLEFHLFHFLQFEAVYQNAYIALRNCIFTRILLLTERFQLISEFNPLLG
jgi:hypothetical protein